MKKFFENIPFEFILLGSIVPAAVLTVKFSYIYALLLLLLCIIFAWLVNLYKGIFAGIGVILLALCAFLHRIPEENTLKKELVVDNDGEILTDTALLTKLKKERARIAKESKLKPYMVFNNQQLVAIATHKPKDKEEFISIYGLGEIKYEFYGKNIIENFIITKK